MTVREEMSQVDFEGEDRLGPSLPQEKRVDALMIAATIAIWCVIVGSAVVLACIAAVLYCFVVYPFETMLGCALFILVGSVLILHR